MIAHLDRRCLLIALGSWLTCAAALGTLSVASDVSLVAVVPAALLAFGLLPVMAWLLRPLTADLAIVTELTRQDRELGNDAPLAPHTLEVAELIAAVAKLRSRSLALLALRENARRQTEEAELLRTSFLAAMGHDLRGPLNAIIGFAELLVMDDHDAVGAAQRPSVDIIRRSAQDLAVLLDQILSWAKLDAGQTQLELQPTRLEAVIAEALSEANTRSFDRGLQVEQDIAPALPVLKADPARLRQALLGLLDHATRANGKPVVWLRVRVLPADELGQERVQIELRDPQLRIREADRNSFFQAFRPSYAPTGRRLGGLGLGPALARALLRAHGGTVWLTSDADSGTTFTVELPLGEPISSVQPSARSAPALRA